VKRSGPTKLSAILEQTLARFGLDRRLDDYRVWQAWDEVVGLTIARNAQPVRLDGSRLVVTVRSSTWLQELSLLQRELILRLNEWMQREVVRELFFVVGRVEDDGARRAAAATVARNTAAAAKNAAPTTSRSVDAPPAQLPAEAAGLSPEVAATFERLWRAARARAETHPGGARKTRG
jgi:hypothetical protein